MSAPEFVPVDTTQRVRSYESPPRLEEPWWADRVADLPAGQPRGPRLGSPGPDQGYALTLATRFMGQLVLAEGEEERDALAGAVSVGLKRASLFGRAPILQDIRVALTIWGFLGEAPAELVERRRALFEEVANPHHYAELRHLTDLIPASVLRMTAQAIEAAHRADWRQLIADEPTGA